jgi:hypothetical protein
MKPLDVTDALTGFGRSPGEPWAGSSLNLDEQQSAVRAWDAFCAGLAPEEVHEMSREQIDRTLAVFGSIIAAIKEASITARGHLRVIPKGRPDGT